MLCLQIIISFHFWNEKMIPFFQRTIVKLNLARWCCKALVKDFFPRPRLPFCWLVPETTRFHSTASCEVEYCKSLEKNRGDFFHFSSSKETKTTTTHSKLSWCNLYVFVFLSHFQIAGNSQGFFEPPHFYTRGVLRGACGDGYLGFRRPLWFGLIGFLLGKWWPIGNCQLSWVLQRCKGEDWISLYTNWEHPFWDIKSRQQIANSSF